MPNPKKHFLIPDMAKLRKAVKNAKGLERVNIDRLYRCLEPDPERSTRDVYDLHWALAYLLDGTEEARENARAAVWIEAIGGVLSETWLVSVTSSACLVQASTSSASAIATSSARVVAQRYGDGSGSAAIRSAEAVACPPPPGMWVLLPNSRADSRRGR